MTTSYQAIDTTLESFSQYGLDVRLEDIMGANDISEYIEALLLEAGIEGENFDSLKTSLEAELKDFNQQLRAQKYDLDRILRSNDISSLERVGIEDMLSEINDWITLTSAPSGQKDILDYVTDAKSDIDALNQTVTEGVAYTFTDSMQYDHGDVITFTFDSNENEDSTNSNTIFNNPVLEGQDPDLMFDYDGDGILDKYYDEDLLAQGIYSARDDNNNDGRIDELDLGDAFDAPKPQTPFYINIREGSSFSVSNMVPMEMEDGSFSTTKFSELTFRLVDENNNVYFMNFKDVDLSKIDFIFTGSMGNLTSDMIETWPDALAQNFFENRQRYSSGYSMWHLLNGVSPNDPIEGDDNTQPSTYVSRYDVSELEVPVLVSAADAENNRTIVLEGFTPGAELAEVSLAGLTNPVLVNYEIDENGRHILDIRSDEGTVKLILDGAKIDVTAAHADLNPTSDLGGNTDIISITGGLEIDPAVYDQIDASQAEDNDNHDIFVDGALYGMILLDEEQTLYDRAIEDNHDPVFGSAIGGTTGDVIGGAIINIFSLLAEVQNFVDDYNSQYGANAFETHYHNQLGLGSENTAQQHFYLWLLFNVDENQTMEWNFEQWLNDQGLTDNRTGGRSSNTNNSPAGISSKTEVDTQDLADILARARAGNIF